VAKALQAAGLTGTGGGATPMMQYEIVCAEPWASSQPAALSDQRGSFEYPADRAVVAVRLPADPKSAAAVGSQQLTACRVPVLAFSGDADPTDQPRNMAGAQQFWPDSRDITLPGQGHSVTSASWPCEGALIGMFIAQASVAHLDTGCLATIAPAFPLTLQALAASG
jgi:pimeloyl-ACP methyl ester carboxylesterase